MNIHSEQKQRQTLSMSSKAIEIGKRRASEERRSFSNYIECLVFADQEKKEKSGC